MARERLLSLLAVEPDVEIAGTAATGGEAVEQIRRLAPDLVFLHLPMPDVEGVGVIDVVGPEHMPPTVVVAECDAYAVRAFDVQALDYLLKPFGRPRFQQALQRARRHLERERAGELAGRLVAVLDELRGPAVASERLLVRSGGRVTLIDIGKIDWVEADGKYVRLHVGGESHLLRETMTALLDRLGDGRFIRIHRSHIVNVGRIRELRLGGGGDYEVVLRDGRRLGLSRGYRDALQERLARGA